MRGSTKVWTQTLAAGESITIIESMNVQRISWQAATGATCTVQGTYELASLPSEAVVNSAGEGGTITATNFNQPIDGLTLTAAGGDVDLIACVN